jgi:hypothetical protein
MSKFEDVLTDWKSDTETIEHLDFEPQLPCEVKNTSGPGRCGAPADFVCRCMNCGASFLYCRPCKEHAVACIENGYAIKCWPCGELSKLPNLRVEWIPIRSAS